MPILSQPNQKSLLAILLTGICASPPPISATEIKANAITASTITIHEELKRQFLNDFGEPRAPWPLCGTVEYDNGPDPTIISKNGQLKKINVTRCSINISTECQWGMFPAEELDTDGRWAWTKSRIGYTLYLRVLAKTFLIPESYLQAELNELENIVLKNINRRLKRPVRLQVYEDETGMGVTNDYKYAGDSFNRAEELFAARWNTYVVSLPKDKQRLIPFLDGVPDGCGAGENVREISLNPPNGRIRIISEIDALVCEAQKKDAWNPDKCEGWSSLPASKAWLSGRYRYVVDWDNKESVRDRLSVDRIADSKICIPKPCE